MAIPILDWRRMRKDASASLLIHIAALCATLGFAAYGVVRPAALAGTIAWLDSFWRTVVMVWLEQQLLPFSWGKTALNAIRTHVVGVYTLVYASSFLAFSTLFGLFMGARSVLSRMGLAVVGSAVSVSFGFVLLVLNVLFPKEYGWALEYAESVWVGFVRFVEIAGVGNTMTQSFVNLARTGLKGHHFIVVGVMGFLSGFLIRFVWDHTLGALGTALSWALRVLFRKKERPVVPKSREAMRGEFRVHTLPPFELRRHPPPTPRVYRRKGRK